MEKENATRLLHFKLNERKKAKYCVYSLNAILEEVPR